jgi:hypothetical protein
MFTIFLPMINLIFNKKLDIYFAISAIIFCFYLFFQIAALPFDLLDVEELCIEASIQGDDTSKYSVYKEALAIINCVGTHT